MTFSLSRKVLRSAILVALSASPSLGLYAQSSSSSTPQQDQPAAQTPAQAPTAPTSSVQARIRARREARRVAAINDVYSHLYEVYVGAGYLRFHPGDGVPPGKGLQRLNEYSWDVGVTRYYSKQLGVTVDGRGIYGSAYTPLTRASNGAITKPAISEYTAMIGPTYRFMMKPKYSVSGRVMAGGAFGKFSGDLGSFTTSEFGLYPNGSSVAFSASVPVEYNVSPGLGIRVAPEYLLTNFGSTIQNSLGFTGGVVVRWGKQ